MNLRKLSIVIGTIAILSTAWIGATFAGTDLCLKGSACELYDQQLPDFKRGAVTGASIWQANGKIGIRFTTKSKKPNLFEVTICDIKVGATTGIRFDENAGKYTDEKAAVTAGPSKQNCETYKLHTGRGIDGLVVTPKAKTISVTITKDGKPAGYRVYLKQGILMPRADAFYFSML